MSHLVEFSHKNYSSLRQNNKKFASFPENSNLFLKYFPEYFCNELSISLSLVMVLYIPYAPLN